MLSIEDQIVLALRRTSQAIDQYSRQLLRDFGVTAPQLATLREIVSGRHTSPMALADVLHVSQPTVTGILCRLEQQGLIQRQKSATDRRSITALATEKGRSLAASAPPLLRDQFRQELARLPNWQQTELLAALQRVAAMMHAPELTEAPFLFHESGEAEARPAPRRRTRRATAPPAASEACPSSEAAGRETRQAAPREPSTR